MIKRPNWDQHEWPSRTGQRLPPAKMLREAERDLMYLFFELKSLCGLKKTRKMFKNYCREPNATDQRYRQQLELLVRLDRMKPKPNVRRLARELLAEKGISPRSSKFHSQFEAIDKKIRRLKKNRDLIEARFKGFSPTLVDGEPTRFRVGEMKIRTFRKREMS
ncbi:hypothetical protein [Bradyrhizobium erythrophlei]|uniref:Uncharacterized protein n=1 Tax=Bradyrhizobium erythrophlei TaxID=1437360 RepID=A0A1M5XB07_9BRAD|nr:hypothetical protein [Bradyrhizobium erythrophlei]SHH96822.1 hypothetical protein SAMN05443248_7179 [Bradyrhizobium erythrophlei]